MSLSGSFNCRQPAVLIVAGHQDFFPPGELLDLSEDEKFSRPAFEKWNSGAALIASGVVFSPLKCWDTGYETLPDPSAEGLVGGSKLTVRSETLLAVADVHQRPDLWSPLNAPVVTVLPSQPVTVATENLAPEPAFVSPGGFTETLQAARAQFGAVGAGSKHQIVETWEVDG